MTKGALLAKGRTAEVYLWGDDKVLKLFYDWCPAPWVKRETQVAESLSVLGVPAPACFGTVTVDSRQGILFERVRGTSLLALMTSHPLRMTYYARIMADLHSVVHAKAGTGLPLLSGWLRKGIQEAAGLEPRLREFAGRTLDGLPEGTALCHFDFHPDQIMMTDKGPVILDWMTAFQGDPRADVARTSLLLTMASVAHMGAVTRTVVGTARRWMHRSYMKRYLAQNPVTDLQSIRTWMIPTAAARMSERIEGETASLVRFMEDAYKKRGVAGRA